MPPTVALSQATWTRTTARTRGSRTCTPQQSLRFPVGAGCTASACWNPRVARRKCSTSRITGGPPRACSRRRRPQPADTPDDQITAGVARRCLSGGRQLWAIATAFETAWNLIRRCPSGRWPLDSGADLYRPPQGLFDDGALEVGFASKGASGVAAKLGTIVLGCRGRRYDRQRDSDHGRQDGIDLDRRYRHRCPASGTSLVSKLLTAAYPVRAAQPAHLPASSHCSMPTVGRFVAVGVHRPVGCHHADRDRGCRHCRRRRSDPDECLGGTWARARMPIALGRSATSTSELSSTATHIQSRSRGGQESKGPVAIFCPGE